MKCVHTHARVRCVLLGLVVRRISADENRGRLRTAEVSKQRCEGGNGGGEPGPLGHLVDSPLLFTHSFTHTGSGDSANYLCIINEGAFDLLPAHSCLSVVSSWPFFLSLPHHRCVLSSQLSLELFYKLHSSELSFILTNARGSSGAPPL